MDSGDLFADFDQVLKVLRPWLRGAGFAGGQRRSGFHMAVTDDRTLLLGFKRSKWNRRDQEHFDFVMEAYIKNETSDYLIWYWKSSTDSGVERPRSDYGVWDRLEPSSDIDEVVAYLKTAAEDQLLPAARHEIENPLSPSIGGTRIDSDP